MKDLTNKYQEDRRHKTKKQESQQVQNSQRDENAITINKQNSLPYNEIIIIELILRQHDVDPWH